MLIANRLQYNNRAEYLLYMWQVEDLLRSYDLNMGRVEKEYLSTFQVNEETRCEMNKWYGELCDMMRAEGKQHSGHLRILQNIIDNLAELHQRLLASEKYPYYRALYYKVLPYIVELRAKSIRAVSDTPSLPQNNMSSELEICFQFLYGLMLLRLQKKEISPDTQAAAKDISDFLGQLSDYWKEDHEGKLALD